MRARSSVVTPERRPPSVSAYRTHVRSVSGVMPNFEATELIAAHWESYSPSCSRTMRTARSLTSRGYLFCVFMTPSSQRLEPPAKAGRFRPSCGVTRTCEGYQGGELGGLQSRPIALDVEGEGIFIQELRTAFAERSVVIHFHAVPEEA